MVKIILDTKEEVIAGSTRLKAGTAQKICLNIISSMVMVKMGRVKNVIMFHMVPTNKKLRESKLRIER
jgi:N-acetylmuramic acid 6-phosphate etherase